MIFIFGFNDGKEKATETTHTEHCSRCGNTNRWMVSKKPVNASLFFIPVFPVKMVYRYYCPICRNGSKISKEKYERLVG